MGSWNGTCGISQLPIQYGDPVIVFLISKESWKDDGPDFCGATGSWVIRSFPIEASYNDYGSFEDINETEFYKYSMSHIQSELVEREADEHNINYAISRKDFNHTILQNGIHSGRLELICHYPQTGRKSIPVGQFMIHRKVFDLALSLYHKKEINNIINRINQINDQLDVIDKRLLQFRLDSVMALSWTDIPGLRSMFSNYIYRENFSGIEKSWIDEFAKVFAVIRFMDETRKSFQPQQGAGSQNCDYSVYRALFATCEQIMKEDEIKCEIDDD